MPLLWLKLITPGIGLCVRVGWSTKSTVLQDLDVVVDKGKVTTGNSVEAITWGDLHATHAEPWVVEKSLEMLDLLKPKFQFLHDIMEGVSVNRHYIKHAPLPHQFFHRWLRGLHRVEVELTATLEILERYLRPWCKTVVPDSNHDGWWLKSWLQRFDYRFDPANGRVVFEVAGVHVRGNTQRQDPQGCQHHREVAFLGCWFEAGRCSILVA